MTGSTRKKTNKERAELRDLSKTIETLESEFHSLQVLIADPTFYQSERDCIQTTIRRLEELPALIETAYARWEELDRA